MSFASSNRTALRGVIESQFGVLEANPVFQRMRYVSENLNFNLQNITSDEIRDDRMTSDLVQVSADASGSVNIELSYGAYDQYLEGVFASTWTSPQEVTATDISAEDDDGNLAFGSVAEDLTVFPVGSWVAVSGFADTTLNGFYRVKTSTTSLLTTYTSYSVGETAGASVTIKNDGRLKNGVERKSFLLQKVLQDATTPTYFNFLGMRVGALNLNFQTAQILTGSLDFMGTDSQSSEAEISGQSVTDNFLNTPMNAVGNVLDIQVDDAATTARFSTLSMAINNALRAQDAIGTLGHVGIALGRLEVTGGINLYFEDKSMYDLYLNATGFSLSFRVKDINNNQYIITIPNIKFETGSVVSGGLDQDVALDATWRAIMDPTTTSMVSIDRFAATAL